MSAALRLVDLDRSMAVTMSPTSLPSSRPMPRFSSRPTLVPSSRAFAPSARASTFDRATEPPTTQRSATTHPRLDAGARHDAKELLAVMRMNVAFLESLLDGCSSPLVLDAIADLHHSIDRLQHRFTTLAPIALRFA